jgi:hypothetical protein
MPHSFSVSNPGGGIFMAYLIDGASTPYQTPREIGVVPVFDNVY